MATLRGDQRNVATGAAALAVGLICGLPLCWLAVELVRASVWQRATWPTGVFASSLLLAGVASILGLLLGAVSALALYKVSTALRRVFLVILCLPLLLPSYLHALAWSGMPGPQGATSSGTWIAGDSGVGSAIWVLVASYSPVAMIALLAALRRWETRFDWSAWTHGRTSRAATLLKARYLLGPAAVGATIIFLLAFADFAVADYFQVRTYATDVFVQVSSYLDTSTATLLSVPVVVVTVAAFAALVRLAGRITLAMSSRTEARRSSEAPAVSRRISVTLLTILSLILVGLPLTRLVRRMGSADVFFEAFRMIWPDVLIGGAIAAACALLAVVVATVAAYGCDRDVRPAGRWLRFLAFATFAIPASLLGLASIGLWNRAGPAGWLYDAGFVLVLAITARWMPIAFEVLAQGWRQVAKGQEEAALTGGRTWFSAFRGVLLRPVAAPLLAAFLLTFIFAFNELTLVTLLAPPGVSTVPLRVFQTIHYGPQSLLAAICVWQVLFLVLPIAVLWTALGRWRRTRGA